MTTIAARQPHSRLRWGLLGGVILIALLIGYGLLRYPTTLTLADETLVLLAMSITLALYVGITLYSTAIIKIDQQVIRSSIGFGLFIGFLWMTEVFSGNFGDPTNPIIMLLYRGSTLLSNYRCPLCRGNQHT